MRKAGIMLRALGALGALIVLGMVTGGGAAVADKGGHGVAVLKAKANLEKEKLFFKGPGVVEKGQKLQVKVLTDVAQVGPHTFSLVKEQTLPKTKEKRKACFEEGICGAIAGWHEVEFPDDPEGEPIVNRPKVFAGNRGWDRLGDFKREGDSIYLENRGESFTQKVTARKGSSLFFICGIHPEMQKEIRVKR